MSRADKAARERCAEERDRLARERQLDAGRTVAWRGWPVEGSRSIDELDSLRPNDPARDEIAKGLNRADQRELMRRYGCAR